ncbi:WD repeat- and FYVE domain-containing protein 4-like [Hemicordylus capensis]|uniref:WD repeat- and FYVE domain-containing protein 4-like n=1 Tax=Hemicordylus capensis TaxID=884348 RepID=UPI00230230B0|nr:WD repeat- and FYVE domain-containing protein 4-like [Hemicordylus capensis]
MKLGVNELSVGIQEARKNQQGETDDNFEQDNNAAISLWPEPKDRSEDEDWVIVSPGALCGMVKLLPRLYNEACPELSWEIQYAVADHIQSLMKTEKNRQVACGAGLLGTIVTSCLDALHNATNPLHLPLIRLFEKLSSQSIEPDVLRKFLCLRTSLSITSGLTESPSIAPLRHRSSSCQAVWDAGLQATTSNNSADLHEPPLGSNTLWLSKSSATALQAAMSLISMTTPRSVQPQSICLAPSFVEFDMSLDGYGCLFIPTLATVLGSNTEYSISGGIGKGIRSFPPLDGLTFSSWFLASKMASDHPLRFLTLVRHMSRTEEEYICFSVSFSPMDSYLTISTEEVVFQTLDIMEPEGLSQSSVLSQVQFKCDELHMTGQWHHLAVTVAKETKRICIVSAYINGKLLGSVKMQYIQPLPGHFVSMDPSSFVDVYGYVATPRIWKQKSSLTWRQGPVYLFEQVLSVEILQLISQLGPRYCSNFQAVELRGGDSSSNAQTKVFAAQEKISFGISAMNSSYTTVKNIKDCYGEVDGRLIAKELELSSRDSITPVLMTWNTAEKLPGPLRTIGAVTVGQYGIRVFQCCPAAICLNYIGGPAILLGLLAMAHDDHAMYAAVKALHSVLNSSAMSENLMRRFGGYQILAYLLKKKSHLLNGRILQLVFSIGGIVETSLDSFTVKNLEAFQHIVCNFELWCHTPENLDFPLFAHLTEILQSSRDGSWNVKLAHQVQVIPRLFLLFSDPEVTCSRVSKICAVLSLLLQGHFSIKDILWIGLFLVYTLQPCSVDENQTCLDVPEFQADALGQTSGKMIWLRNQLLKMLLDVLHSDKLHLSSEMQEEVFQALGPDWFLMFTQGHMHPATVVLAVRLLLHFLHNRTLLHKFKEGMMAGLWLENSSVGLNILMDNLESHTRISEYSPYLLSGFVELKTFLSNCTHVPEIYFLLSGLFLATPVSEPPDDIKTDLDSVFQWLLQNHHTEAVLRAGLCPEAAILLLEMVKSMVKRTLAGTEDSWEITYPVHIMQFFCLVYHRYSQDLLWCNSDFLQALALVIFPSVVPQGNCEGDSSPDSLAAASCSERGCADLHPARKQVWDFIRLLLMETLLVVSAQKQWHPLELLLEVSAENSTTEQKRCFQTEILLSIIDIFHVAGQDDGKASILRGNSDAKTASELAVPLSLLNVSYFTQKLTEKLCAGMFIADPTKIIQFLVEQLVLVIETVLPHKESVISILYSSLNRAILYCMSISTSDQQRLLKVLCTLQQQWDIIFATHNSSINFITCLLFCLFQLESTSCPKDHEAKWNSTSEHHSFLTPKKEEEMKDYLSAPKNVQQDIWKATEDIWDQLLSQKRKDLEDTYKMALFVDREDGNGEMKMTNISPLWEETMAKTWQQFLASEKKILQNKISAQTSNKLSSLSESFSSAMKLTPSRNIKQMKCKTKDFVSCLEKYRRCGQELYAVLYKDCVQRLLCVYNQSAKAWIDVEEQLFRRGGPWGSALVPSASRWILDGYEGPSRMRKRIRFRIIHHTLVALRNKDHQTQESASAPAPEGKQELMLNGGERGMGCGQLTFFPTLHESFHSEDLVDDVCMERKIILQEFAEGEKITCRESVVIVQGHTTLEGVLLFGQEYFYICKYFTLSHLEEVYCTKHRLSSINDSFIHSLCYKDQDMGQPTCSGHSYNDIKGIHPMRFLLQEVALEVFFRSGYSIFLVFHNSDRTKALKRFCSMKPVLKSKGITEDSINIRNSTGGEKTMLMKWQRREISNFDYLMYLNTLAGRTYNDLMQYPVFPWVLADYHSQTLDLTNPSSFRDLSKPMGAQTTERKEKFIQRYKEVEKSEGNLSAQCHYCTHYSSAIIVASYLVRIEPFSQILRSLQGGGFDVADRMFHSMKNTWDSVSKDNMTDVRELIPEFFYLPEFLTNCNQFELGSLQDGTLLGDVQLPPWAEGNPHRFINLHRQALESNYVSAHLHQWIDLIFGYKQNGPAAVKAVNIFHPYFYGDQVHLDNISDPLIKNTILGFVSNFGQIPKQLFTKPHPARNALGKHPSGREGILFPSPASQLPPPLSSLHNLKLSSVALKEELHGPVGHIVCTEKGILAVGENKILLPPLWNRAFCWGFGDFTCCLADYGSDKNLVTFEATADWGDCLCAVCPTPTTLITSGSSSVMCAWELSVTSDGATCLNLKKPLYGHTESVTCLAASMSYSIIVSGSVDRSCIIWDLNQLTHITQLPAHEACLSAVAINDSTGDIASCAGASLHLWNVNGQPLARVSPTFSLGATISCCCFTEVMDWNVHSLIVTGDTGGNVQVWKLQNTSHPYQNIRSQEDSLKCKANNGNKAEEPFVLCQELDLSVTPSKRPRTAIPSVTALAVSRNYSKLLIGDEKGKVYCWSVDG